MLNHPEGTVISTREQKSFNDVVDGNASSNSAQVQAKQDAPPFRVPPVTAIAGVLIRDWAEGRIGFEAKQGLKL